MLIHTRDSSWIRSKKNKELLKEEEIKETDIKSNIDIVKNNESIIKPQSQKRQKVISEKRCVTLHNLKRNKRAKKSYLTGGGK